MSDEYRDEHDVDGLKVTRPGGGVEMEIRPGDALKVIYYNTYSKSEDVARGVVERVTSRTIRRTDELSTLIKLSTGWDLYGVHKRANITYNGRRQGYVLRVYKLFEDREATGRDVQAAVEASEQGDLGAFSNPGGERVRRAVRRALGTEEPEDCWGDDDAPPPLDHAACEVDGAEDATLLLRWVACRAGQFLNDPPLARGVARDIDATAALPPEIGRNIAYEIAWTEAMGRCERQGLPVSEALVLSLPSDANGQDEPTRFARIEARRERAVEELGLTDGALPDRNGEVAGGEADGR